MPHTQAQELSKHRWQHRLLLILTDNINSPAYQRQIAALSKEQADLTERKLVIYTLTPKQYRTGLTDENSWKPSDSLYEKYRKAVSEVEVVLIGLDGGVKLREQDILSCEKLFAVIDAMPMRRAEIRKQR